MAGGLPPEVEAELRRRAQSETLAPVAAPEGGSPLVAAAPQVEAPPPPPSWSDRLRRMGPIGVFLAYLLGKLKFLALILKFALPILKTGGTMLLSIVVYAQAFGWWFAVGFVLSIFVHEMGHVYVAWRLGMPVSVPIFIPGFGAVILARREARSAWEGALLGIGGPVAGTLAGLACLLLYHVTRSPLMLGLAYTGFFINLFNMAPLFPLDGGWITGAVSPRIWLLGIVVMVGLFVTGTLRNPLILILVVLSLPRLLRGLRTDDITPMGGVPTTSHQRMVMGIAYVAICGLLYWLMTVTQRPI